MFIFNLLDFALDLYVLGLFAYILCSWIIHPAASALRQWLSGAYEPLLSPIRRWIRAPRLGHMTLDLSPIILLIALGLFRRLLFAFLR